MTHPAPTQIRIAACPEKGSDGNEWTFYVLNDGEASLSRIVLDTVEWEWGDHSELVHPNAEVTNLAPNASSYLWRDKDNEVRLLLHLRVMADESEERFLVQFPLLYKRRNEVSRITGLGRDGWVESAKRQS